MRSGGSGRGKGSDGGCGDGGGGGGGDSCGVACSNNIGGGDIGRREVEARGSGTAVVAFTHGGFLYSLYYIEIYHFIVTCIP